MFPMRQTVVELMLSMRQAVAALMEAVLERDLVPQERV